MATNWIDPNPGTRDISGTDRFVTDGNAFVQDVNSVYIDDDPSFGNPHRQLGNTAGAAYVAPLAAYAAFNAIPIPGANTTPYTAGQTVGATLDFDTFALGVPPAKIHEIDVLAVHDFSGSIGASDLELHFFQSDPAFGNAGTFDEPFPGNAGGLVPCEPVLLDKVSARGTSSLLTQANPPAHRRIYYLTPGDHIFVVAVCRVGFTLSNAHDLMVNLAVQRIA